ncbi:MAG: hypothetical protein LBU10_04810 [Endomicrobium sp.]|jgi:hypothetical protein|nr:hypothetical protein [Endomicrobium sp.]
MKKIVVATIISMTIFANVFAKDTKPIETLESKNEVCIIIEKAILRNVYCQDAYGKVPLSEKVKFGKWIPDFKIVADYCSYIDENNNLGLGLGITINPTLQIYDIYCLTKFKVPLTNRWFLGAGVGLGNVDTKDGGSWDLESKNIFKDNCHKFFKLFTCFNFKNISIYLSYTQDILYGQTVKSKWYFTERLETLNLGVAKRFII